MVEKNIRKLEAKKNRVWFNMKMGTVTHASKRNPERTSVKADTRKLLREFG